VVMRLKGLLKVCNSFSNSLTSFVVRLLFRKDENGPDAGVRHAVQMCFGVHKGFELYALTLVMMIKPVLTGIQRFR
jgi:hypothetical protein